MKNACVLPKNEVETRVRFRVGVCEICCVGVGEELCHRRSIGMGGGVVAQFEMGCGVEIGCDLFEREQIFDGGI